MKKIVFFMIIILIFIGCASTSPSGNPDVYIEKTLSDVINLKFNQSDGFLERQYHGREWPEELTFRFVSLAYIKVEKDFIILSDDSGNNINVYGKNDVFRIYGLRENGDFDPKKLYRVYYRIIPRESNFVKIAGIKNIDLEGIEGLMTFKEYENSKEEENRRKKQDETAKKGVEAEAAYREALSSRNPDTIISFLRSGMLNSISDDRQTEIRTEARLEVAKIITKNNKIEIGNFNKSFTNSSIDPINPYAFETDKIYFLTVAEPQQFISGKIIASVAGDSNAIILLQNIPNIQGVGGSLRYLYMKYKGVTTLKLANGRSKEVATFDLIYYYKN